MFQNLPCLRIYVYIYIYLNICARELTIYKCNLSNIYFVLQNDVIVFIGKYPYNVCFLYSSCCFSCFTSKKRSPD